LEESGEALANQLLLVDATALGCNQDEPISKK